MMQSSHVSSLIFFILIIPATSYGNTISNEIFPENDMSNDILISSARNRTRSPCDVPRYPPYFWVKDVARDKIILGVTDPNKESAVKGYSVYYWGHRFGVESTLE